MRLTRLLFVLLLLPGVAPGQRNSALLDQAQAEASAGHKEQAIELYRRVLHNEPDNVQALSALSDVLEFSGRWREAVPLLTRLVQLQPSAATLYRLGRMKSWMDGGQTEATALLQRAVAAAPQNPDYKVTYAGVLSRDPRQSGEAIRILTAVIAAHPEHVEGRRLLALLLAREHRVEDARQVLQPLLQRPHPALEDYQAQAEIEENAADMRAAAEAYRHILALDPANVPAITKLAEVLSWDRSTRQQSIALYEQGLKLDPGNSTLLTSYAQVLSWNDATRPRAMELFDQALAKDPNDPRALNGKAQLLAWSGRSQEALALYDQVLAKNPADPDALRGKAEILNWRGKYVQSRELASQAHELAPDDPRIGMELARANVGLQNYAQAREDLALAQGLPGPEFNALQQDINRGLGTYMELGYIGRRNRQQLDFNRLDARISTPLSSSNRITFDYEPTLYNTVPEEFNSNHFGVALDSQPREQFTTHLEFSADQYPGEPTEWNTSAGMHYRVTQDWTLQAGFDREPVEETPLSVRGTPIDGVFTGEVQSNLASVGASYSNSVHQYDASLSFSGGAYTGHNLDSNRRWGLDFNVGKSIRGNAPYLRIAYGVSYVSFDHDADFQPGQTSPNITGGYYSPTKFLLNYGGLNASHKLARKLEWDAAATAGIQNAETTFEQFSTPHFASTFATHVVWHVTASNDIRGGYDYLNVFNAFHRHLFDIIWRHYF